MGLAAVEYFSDWICGGRYIFTVAANLCIWEQLPVRLDRLTELSRQGWHNGTAKVGPNASDSIWGYLSCGCDAFNKAFESFDSNDASTIAKSCSMPAAGCCRCRPRSMAVWANGLVAPVDGCVVQWAGTAAAAGFPRYVPLFALPLLAGRCVSEHCILLCALAQVQGTCKLMEAVTVVARWFVIFYVAALLWLIRE